MVRTRDFVLLFTVIIFLLLAIGVTVLDVVMPARTLPSVLVSAEPAPEAGAEVVLSTNDRASRARELAEKIAASRSTYLSAAPTETPSLPENAPEPVVATIEPLWCGSYVPYSGSWSSQGVSMTVIEGVRVYTRASAPVASTTTTPTTPLLTLPAASVPGIPYCLPSDVIGIATDGSLIRNNESAVYAIFGPDTVIGYALDGFPIYGLAPNAGDECGGVSESTGYRYHLHPDRDYILGCFSASPVQLP